MTSIEDDEEFLLSRQQLLTELEGLSLSHLDTNSITAAGRELVNTYQIRRGPNYSTDAELFMLAVQMKSSAFVLRILRWADKKSHRSSLDNDIHGLNSLWDIGVNTETFADLVDKLDMKSETINSLFKFIIRHDRTREVPNGVVECLEVLCGKAEQKNFDINFINILKYYPRHKSVRYILEWLLHKISFMAEDTLDNFLSCFGQFSSEDDEETTVWLMEKILSDHPDIQPSDFLLNFSGCTLLLLFFEKTTGMVQSATLCEELLREALLCDNLSLFEIIIERSPKVTVDYGTLVQYCIYRDVPSYGGEGLFRNHLLERLIKAGVDINTKSKRRDCGWSFIGSHTLHNKSELYPVELLARYPEALQTLLYHGANVSILDPDFLIDFVVHYSQVGNVSLIEQFLHICDPSVVEVLSREVFKSLSCWSRHNESKCLELYKLCVEFGFNIQREYPFNTYNNSDTEMLYPLPFLLRFGPSKLSHVILAMIEARAPVGDFPILAHCIMSDYNADVIHAILDNEYSLTTPVKTTGPTSPLEVALNSEKYCEFATAILQRLTDEEIIYEEKFNHTLSKRINRCVPNLPLNFEDVLIYSVTRLRDLISPVDMLSFACKKGFLGLLTKLHSVGVELNQELPRSTDWTDETCLHLALEFSQSEVVSCLLDQSLSLSCVNDLHRVLSKCKLTNGVTIRIIDQMISNGFDANAVVNAATDMTALDVAAIRGNYTVFKHLLQCGADLNRASFRGFTAPLLALFEGNLSAVHISDVHFSFPLPCYHQLVEFITHIMDKSNFYLAQHEIGLIAAKFACALCDDSKELSDQLTNYLSVHYGAANHETLHRAAEFTLPEGTWNRRAWSELAMTHGSAITNYLYLAERIESLTAAAGEPISKETIRKYAQTIKYVRADVDVELSLVLFENNIAEHIFNRIADMLPLHITGDYIPNVCIDGLALGSDYSRYCLSKLSKGDYRGFVLGKSTNCCQSVGGFGHDCAMHGMISPYGGFYVLRMRPKPGRCNTLNTLVQTLTQSNSLDEFLQGFTDKHSKAKYKHMFGVANKSYEECKIDVLKELQAELDGEIIAQFWAWISKSNNVVIDSWEVLRKEDNALFIPFMKAFTLAVLKYPLFQGDKVVIGAEGQTPFIGDAGPADECPIDYNLYRDASYFQHILGRRGKSALAAEVRLHSALSLSLERIAEIRDTTDSDYLQCYSVILSVQVYFRQRNQPLANYKSLLTIYLEQNKTYGF